MRHKLRAACLGLFVTVSLGLGYVALSLEMFVGVWGDSRYPDRGRDPLKVVLLTQPLSARNEAAWRRALAAAREHERRFVEPQAVQTNRFFGFSYVSWYRSPVAQIEKLTNIVIVDTARTQLFEDDELVCVFSHEIGHAVWRDVFGDPDSVELPDPALRHVHEEGFADAFAKTACGVDAWERVRTKVGIKRQTFDDL